MPACTAEPSASASSPTWKRRGCSTRSSRTPPRLNFSDRSKTPIEPYLSDQWFVRMDDLRPGRDGRRHVAGGVKIHPERYAKSYLDWLGEKRDWCISRQLWWGHRIPIWHCADVPPKPSSQRAFARSRRRDLAPRRDRRLADLRRDRPCRADALGPGSRARRRTPTSSTPGSARPSGRISTLGWPEETPELAKYYPDERPLDGPRHHHALGGADGHLRPVQHAATCHSATSSSTP